MRHVCLHLRLWLLVEGDHAAGIVSRNAVHFQTDCDTSADDRVFADEVLVKVVLLP